MNARISTRDFSVLMLFAVGGLISLSGCSTTTMVRQGEHFGFKAHSTLHLQGGRTLQVREARVDGDTLRAVHHHSGSPVGVSVASTDRLVHRDRKLGAMQGLAAGLAAGVILSGTPAGNCTDTWGWEQDRCTIGGGMVGPLLVGLAGLVGASVADHAVTRTFVFERALVDGDSSRDGGEAGLLPHQSIAKDTAPTDRLDEVHRNDGDRITQVKPHANPEGHKPDTALYFMLTFGPAYGNAPSGPSNLGGWDEDNIGFFASAALGVEMGARTMLGIRLGVGYMEGAFTEDWMGEATLFETRMEMLRFLADQRTYLKAGLGISWYGYEELALAPGMTDVRNKHSSAGGTAAFGAGYAFGISPTLRLLLDGELSYSHYLDGAGSLAIKPSLSLAWF